MSMTLEYITTPTFAAVAFAAYLQLSSVVAGRASTAYLSGDGGRSYRSARVFRSNVFKLLVLVGAGVAVTRFLIYEDCHNFLGGWPFGHATCEPGFRFFPTVMNVVGYLPLIGLLSSAGYALRALVAHFTKNVVRRNELLIGLGVCLVISACAYGLRNMPPEPCGIAGCARYYVE